MSRYIDANALIEYLKEMWGKWDEDDWYEAQAKDALEDDIEIVNKQPTVDAVQVVRCKDCKHSTKVEGIVGLVWCEHLAEVGTWIENDWFCADGERRTER